MTRTVLPMFASSWDVQRLLTSSVRAGGRLVEDVSVLPVARRLSSLLQFDALRFAAGGVVAG